MITLAPGHDLQSAVATGNDLHLMPGVYPITESTSMVMTAGQSISGVPGRTIIKVTNGVLAGGDNVFRLADDCTLRGVSIIEEEADAKSRTEGVAVNIRGDNCKVIDVLVEGFFFCFYSFNGHDNHLYERCTGRQAYSWQFYVDGVTNCRYNNCESSYAGVDGYKSSSDNGPCHNLTYIGCLAHHNGIRNIAGGGSEHINGHGFDMYHGGDKCQIIGCHSWANTGSGFVQKDNGFSQSACKIIGGSFNEAIYTNGDGQPGITIGLGGTNGGMSAKVIGATVHGNSGDGVSIMGGSGVSIIGCTITENNIGVRSKGTGTMIESNTIAGNELYNVLMGSEDTGTYKLTGSVIRSNTILGNWNPAATGPPQDWPDRITTDNVRVYSDTGCLTIADNYMTSPKKRQIISRARNVLIEKNVFYNSTSSAIATYAGPGHRILDNEIYNSDFAENTNWGAIRVDSPRSDIYRNWIENPVEIPNTRAVTLQAAATDCQAGDNESVNYPVTVWVNAASSFRPLVTDQVG